MRKPQRHAPLRPAAPVLPTISSGEQWPGHAPRRCRLTSLLGIGLVVSALSTSLLIAVAPTTAPANRAVRKVLEVARNSSSIGRLFGGNSSCRDDDDRCAEWAAAGECIGNPHFMRASCRLSCGMCFASVWSRVKSSCKDKSSFCGQWAAVGECDSNPHYMRANCPVTCHLCQSADCHDLDTEACEVDVRRGQCHAEPERMYKRCRWSCKWCAMETGSRCRRPAGMQPAARAGSLEAMFERAVSAEHAHLQPVVHSRDPWVVTFESFLSDAEADRIIAVGGQRWARSQAGDGVQAVRTSSTAWCDPHSCQRDPILAAVRRRIANLTLVPERNAEHLQVLKYDTGQFYKTHHDQNSPTTSYWGPRMYTFFMYLNDCEGGGQTHFPRLNISVAPRRGRALLWPSVLNEDPNLRDDRTEHEAVAVSAGRKYAANYWLHMYDFQLANDRGCGNTEVFGNWPTR